MSHPKARAPPKPPTVILDPDACKPTATKRCATFRTWLLGGGGKHTTPGATTTTATTTAGSGRRAGAMSGGVSGADGEAKLLKLGLEPASERRRVMAVVTKVEENPQLMNWFQVYYPKSKKKIHFSCGIEIFRRKIISAVRSRISSNLISYTRVQRQ